MGVRRHGLMRKGNGAWREETESEAEGQAFGVCVMDPLFVSSTGSLGI
jgi:hypothetical protein